MDHLTAKEHKQRLTKRAEKRPEIVFTNCGNCEFNDGDCSGWKCATVPALKLACCEHTCLVNAN